MELRRFLYLTRCSLRVCFIILNNVYCIPTYLLWMWFFFLPFRILNYPIYWHVESVMYKWLLSVVASWSWSANYHILEIGDDIDSCINDRCLFLANHQSTADVPFFMLAFSGKPNVLESVMWIMDRMFRYTNFGLVSVTHGDYFITQGKNVRDYQMKKLRDHLLNIFIARNRRWIILFPEGGFLSKRKETSVKYAKKNNFPVLNRVTLPRVGAMNIILETLHPENIKEALENGEVSLLRGTEEECKPLKWVIDVTVAYPEPEKPLDLLAICTASRPQCYTYMHYRRYAISEVPYESMESLRDWVYDRWTEKEELLNEYYETSIFPLLPKSQRVQEGSKNQHMKDKSESQQTDEKNSQMTDKSQSKQIDEKNPQMTDKSESEQIDEKIPQTADESESQQIDEKTTQTKEESESQLMKNKSTHCLPKAQLVILSDRWIVCLHFFFISSSMFHCYLLNKMWNFIRI